ncbi:MAG: MarR family transcriptional regulator [Micropruina sp.]|uniref:MarR family winged helix-turn-helix transcriptional regulator n=1 Tax=Micropruina sp. TaxID=2737536 RepID=UPI0039E5F9AB
MQLSEELTRLFTLLWRITNDQRRGATLARLEYLILARLYREGAMRAGDLAHIEGLDPSTLSRRVAALVDRELLLRETDPDDRRAQQLQLTDAGRAQFLAEQQRRVAQVTDAVAHWPATDRTMLAHLLHDLNDSLQKKAAS